MELPDALLDLLRKPSLCFLATTMPDGSPQLTETWVDTDGSHILVNTVQGFQKLRNIERDPRVALNVADSQEPTTYYAIRGRVVHVTTERGAEHIEELSQKYLGRPYPQFGGPGGTRVIIRIAVDRLAHTPEW